LSWYGILLENLTVYLGGINDMLLLILINFILGAALTLTQLPTLLAMPMHTKADVLGTVGVILTCLLIGIIGIVLMRVVCDVYSIVKKFNSLPWREK
jgi:hypothetical protein